MDTINLLKKINAAGIMFVFLWISFFTPFASEEYQSIVIISILSIFIITSLCLNPGAFRLLFDKREAPFWIFLFTLSTIIWRGGILTFKEPSIVYRNFWLFIFPIPFYYFFAKIGFSQKYGVAMIRGICIMALLVCFYGIFEFITKQNFIYKYFMNNMYRVFLGRRMISTQIHPTPLGTYFVAILPLSIALSLKEKKASLKFIFSICVIFNFIGIILTFSRGVLLGAFVSIFVMVIFLTKQKKRPLFLAAVLLIIIIGFCSFIAHWTYADFHRYSLQGLSVEWNYSGKIYRFIAVGKILREHPFFGLGLGHFRLMFDYYLPQLANFCNYDSKVADCMYITVLTETGLIGFAVFILFICFLFKQIKMRLKTLSENENRLLLLCFLSGLIGIMCSFFTYDGLYWRIPSYLFWSYAGILSSLSRRPENE